MLIDKTFCGSSMAKSLSIELSVDQSFFDKTLYGLSMTNDVLWFIDDPRRSIMFGTR